MNKAIDWSQEVWNSALWLVKAFGITAVVFFVVMALLARFTVWGRQFWALNGGYFTLKRSWKPIAGVALMLVFTLAAVRMNVLFSYWYNGFYTGLQALDAKAFWFHMGLFAVLASIHVARALINAYIRSAFSIHWRVWVNDKLVGEWLGRRAYYLGRFAKPHVDNPEQRIQQDVTDMSTLTLTLALGLVSALVSMYEFTGILWNLSAPMTVAGVEVPRAMVFLVYAYVLVATVFAVWIGRPLIALNFINERVNATYRYLLIRVREYGESVALYRGETVERRNLDGGYRAVIRNAWDVLYRTLKLDGYNLGISQVAVIFPFLIQAPRLFAGQIKLGDVMQTGQAFGQVQDALSFFRESYDQFAGYRATLERLSGFEQNIDAADKLALPDVQPNAQAVVLSGLTVNRPDGQPLVRDVNLQLAPGGSLLIRGPSGSGKTTLLRTLAGLWPFSSGRAERPPEAGSLFLAQKPYLPLGTLRMALAYPAETIDDATAREVLHKVQLGHLAKDLDLEQDWSQVLSGGEQQRLAFGRALINKPAVVFLDEATSATDSGLEHALYTLLRAELPQAMLVSVGHRETLLAFHDQTLTLDRDGGWTLQAAPRPA